MAADQPTPDATLIQQAYEDAVKTLFNTLFTGLASAPPSPQNDKECAQRFASGVQLAKHALALALKALPPRLNGALALERPGAIIHHSARSDSRCRWGNSANACPARTTADR